jgi:transcriptional regulator with XRE-family HTH domain
MQGKRRGGHVDAVVGQTIRLLRLQKHLSQTALAQKIGVSFQQVQKYENGTNRVGASRMVQIAQALHVPLESLFQRIDGTHPKAEPGDDPLALISNSQALRMARAFADISNNQIRIAIVALIESIAERERSSAR